MATLTVFLVSLPSSTAHSTFLSAIKQSEPTPLVVARVVQWLITPTYSSHLLSHTWDFMLIISNQTFPSHLAPLVAHTFSISFHVPQNLISIFFASNSKYLDLSTSSTPTLQNLAAPLIATSTQRVELTPALLAFARSTLCPAGPVSMLNFVSFHPFRQARESYGRYIEAFKAGVGAKRGGKVKLIGETGEVGEWDEVVLAQYDDLVSFADMCADPEYQKANLELRLPALRDTCILMTTEVELDWEINGSSKWEG